MNRFVFYFFALLCVLIGLYPAIYFFVGNDFGLKVHKPDVLLNDIYWNAAFYLHIVFGGIALLIGWMQFPAKFRRKHIRWHRRIGLSYLFASSYKWTCRHLSLIHAYRRLDYWSWVFQPCDCMAVNHYCFLFCDKQKYDPATQRTNDLQLCSLFRGGHTASLVAHIDNNIW